MNLPTLKTIAVFSIATLVLMIVSWANPVLFSGTSMVSLAEATSGHTHTHSHGNFQHSHWHSTGKHHGKSHNHSHDDDKDKDKDKDKDNDVEHSHPHRHGHQVHTHTHVHEQGNVNNHNHEHPANDDKADCDQSVYVNRHIGICSNRGTVTVAGMKRYVNVSSGSGPVLADVTSKAVHLESKSGDLTARGLTSLGIFETRIGNVRVKYCQRVKKNTGNLYVKIIDSNPEGADADLQFTSNSKINPAISNDPGKFKTDFTSHHNGLVIRGSVTKGNLFISEYIIKDPPCPY